MDKKITKKKLIQLERREIKKKFKEWAESARARWNNKCAVCRSKERINIHHIVPREVKELRFDQRNAIALCASHHKFDNLISAHKNPFVFFMWFRESYPDEFIQLENLVRTLKSPDVNVTVFRML